MDLALDTLQRLICHKTQTNKLTNILERSEIYKCEGETETKDFD